ncbi:uncharacterized protein METZ01_LOCUS15910 [marine metagenome]|uniref:Uncharacterized protein n=1 Tax=marine metagenome TaxID=408172 RepID=A0A381P7X6_9ZZZZ
MIISSSFDIDVFILISAFELCFLEMQIEAYTNY